MKKFFLKLSCFAAVAIATFIGNKSFETSAYETTNLFSENVESLSDCEVPNGKEKNGHCTQNDKLEYFCESPGFLDHIDCVQ